MIEHVAELEKESGFTLGIREEKAETQRLRRVEERKSVAEYWGLKSEAVGIPKSSSWWRDATRNASRLAMYFAASSEVSTGDQFTNARNIPLEKTCATCLWVPECVLVGVTADKCQYYALELHPSDDMEAVWRRDHRRMNGGGPPRKVAKHDPGWDNPAPREAILR